MGPFVKSFALQNTHSWAWAQNSSTGSQKGVPSCKKRFHGCLRWSCPTVGILKCEGFNEGTHFNCRSLIWNCRVDRISWYLMVWDLRNTLPNERVCRQGSKAPRFRLFLDHEAGQVLSFLQIGYVARLLLWTSLSLPGCNLQPLLRCRLKVDMPHLWLKKNLTFNLDNSVWADFLTVLRAFQTRFKSMEETKVLWGSVA